MSDRRFYWGSVIILIGATLLAGCQSTEQLPSHVQAQIERSPPDKISVPDDEFMVSQRTFPPALTSQPLRMSQALPELTLSETVAEALGRIGAPAVMEVSQALASEEPQMRIAAAEILARIGPDARDAVPALILLLEDENEDVRKAAARALGEIGPAAAPAVPALLETLRELKVEQNASVARTS